MIYIYKAELVRVVDGDTVDLIIDLGFDTSRKERFRLYGIDAPEMNTAAGMDAKEWLKDALMPLEAIYVQTIQLPTKAKRDKYGRCLAVLYDQFPQAGQIGAQPGSLPLFSVNLAMVDLGHAMERYW
jgi:micrococcal nuclease